MEMVQCPNCQSLLPSEGRQCFNCGLKRSTVSDAKPTVPPLDAFDELRSAATAERGAADGADNQPRGKSIKFVPAILRCLVRWLNFSGRAPRNEYWWWALFSFLVNRVFNFVLSALTPVAHQAVAVHDYATMQEVSQKALWLLLLSLVMFLPGLSVLVRRLHDVGKSGWNFFWAFTLVGILYLLYLVVQPTQERRNKWGSPDYL